jgi:hypothetical protein
LASIVDFFTRSWDFSEPYGTCKWNEKNDSLPSTPSYTKILDIVFKISIYMFKKVIYIIWVCEIRKTNKYKKCNKMKEKLTSHPRDIVIVSWASLKRGFDLFLVGMYITYTKLIHNSVLSNKYDCRAWQDEGCTLWRNSTLELHHRSRDDNMAIIPFSTTSYITLQPHTAATKKIFRSIS